jgi:hypothetical protein
LPTLPPPLRGPLSVSRAASFDHLVGRGKQRPWDIEAERFRRLEIDRQFKFGRRLNRRTSTECIGIFCVKIIVTPPTENFIQANFLNFQFQQTG